MVGVFFPNNSFFCVRISLFFIRFFSENISFFAFYFRLKIKKEIRNIVSQILPRVQMVGTTRTKAAAAANPTNEMKAQVSKHCVETAIAAVNRACDFRVKEIDALVENYISILPVDVRKQKLVELV